MSLLTNESPLIILPSLALKLGTNEAIFLQQLHYWLGKTNNTHNGIKWAYNTIQQWADQLKIMSVATIERAVAKLKKLGILLVEKLNPNKSDRTNFYSINYKKLVEVIGQHTCQNQPIKLMQSPPQAEVIQYRKPKQTIPSKRGNVLTENTKDNQKNLINEQGKHRQSSAVQSIIGTTEPTQPPASAQQLNQLPVDTRRFYQQLRQLRLDISHNDPRISQWLNANQAATILRHIAFARQRSSTPYGWHQAEQLGIAPISLCVRAAA